MGRVLVWHKSGEENGRIVESPAISKAIHSYCSEAQLEIDFFRITKRPADEVVFGSPQKCGMRKGAQKEDFTAFENDKRSDIRCWKTYRKHQCHHFVAPVLVYVNE